MDLSRLSLTGWSSLAAALDAPDALIAALVSAIATLGLIACFGPRLPFARAGKPPAQRLQDGGASDYLINGASLKPLTEPARALLDGLVPGGPRLAALSAHFADACPGLQGDIEALVL